MFKLLVSESILSILFLHFSTVLGCVSPSDEDIAKRDQIYKSLDEIKVRESDTYKLSRIRACLLIEGEIKIPQGLDAQKALIEEGKLVGDSDELAPKTIQKIKQEIVKILESLQGRGLYVQEIEQILTQKAK